MGLIGNVDHAIAAKRGIEASIGRQAGDDDPSVTGAADDDAAIGLDRYGTYTAGIRRELENAAVREFWIQRPVRQVSGQRVVELAPDLPGLTTGDDPTI